MNILTKQLAICPEVITIYPSHNIPASSVLQLSLTRDA